MVGIGLLVARGLHGVAVRWWWLPALAVLAAFGARSFVRADEWRSAERLWRSALAHNPESFRAHAEVALWSWRAGDVVTARRHFEWALAVEPRFYPAMKGLAEALTEEGSDATDSVLLERAVELSARIVTERPLDPLSRLRLSRALRARGMLRNDAEDLRASELQALHCLEIAVPKALVFQHAAEARAATGDLQGALELLDQAERRDLPRVPLRVCRAELLAAAQRPGDAVAIYRSLLQQSPFERAWHLRLAELYELPAMADRERASMHRALAGEGAAPVR
jgi:tetratricopeptide (TPR) repeat protein